MHSSARFWRSTADQAAGAHNDPTGDTSGLWWVSQPLVENWAASEFYPAGLFVLDDAALYLILRRHTSTTTRPAADTTNYLALDPPLSTLADYSPWMQSLSGDFSAASKAAIERVIWNDFTVSPTPALDTVPVSSFRAAAGTGRMLSTATDGTMVTVSYTHLTLPTTPYV